MIGAGNFGAKNGSRFRMAVKRSRWPERALAYLENAVDVRRTYFGKNDAAKIRLGRKRNPMQENDFDNLDNAVDSLRWEFWGGEL